MWANYFKKRKGGKSEQKPKPRKSRKNSKKKGSGSKKDGQEKINCEKVGTTRYAVNFTKKYFDEIKSAVKASGVCFWIHDNRRWEMEEKDIPKLESFIQRCSNEQAWNFDVRFGVINEYSKALDRYPIPFTVKRSHNLPRYDYNKDQNYAYEASNVPMETWMKLKRYQKEGITFALKHNGRILLGDEMGVGKTLQAICIGVVYHSDWPLLILCPSSLKLNWQDELLKWVPEGKEDYNINQEDIQIVHKNKDKFEKGKKIYIISYDIATNKGDDIARLKFKVCLCDEAHALKNRESKRSKNLVPLLEAMKRIILISGTPLLSRPCELYNLVKILRPDVFKSFEDFGEKYCDPKTKLIYVGGRRRAVKDLNGASNLGELNYLLSKHLMIRRMKKDVLKELPPKNRIKMIVEISPKDMKELKKLFEMSDALRQKFEQDQGTKIGMNDFLRIAQKGILLSDDSQLETKNPASELYKQSGIAKVEGGFKFVETLLENGIKFLLFCHHQDVMNAYEERIKKKRINFIRIDGSTSQTKRHEYIKQFQERKECKIALLSITAAYQGITLHAANVVVFAEYYWTPGIITQAEDRVHRVGQLASNVTVYYLHNDKTLDSGISGYIMGKAEISSNVLDNAKSEYVFKRTNKKSLEQEIEKQREERKDLDLKLSEIKAKNKSSMYAYLKKTVVESEEGDPKDVENKSMETNKVVAQQIVDEAISDSSDTSSDEEEVSKPPKSNIQNSQEEEKHQVGLPDPSEGVEDKEKLLKVQNSLMFSEFLSSVKKGEDKYKNLPLYDEAMNQEEIQEIEMEKELQELSDADFECALPEPVPKYVTEKLNPVLMHPYTNLSTAHEEEKTAQIYEQKLKEIEKISDTNLNDILSDGNTSSLDLGSSLLSDNEKDNLHKNLAKNARERCATDFRIEEHQEDSFEITSDLVKSDDSDPLQRKRKAHELGIEPHIGSKMTKLH
ncbi:unnamed protein product [Moneuplotes crassus]|uniref:Uncharacterized protein n=1 Tax=Euplotes crassus TaxID=5936 RepID=A0AAD2D3A0_EUPCR|nr:unnamed protein product [Moneuplotes crassus]